MKILKTIFHLALIILGLTITFYSTTILFSGIDFSITKHHHESQDFIGASIFTIIGLCCIFYGWIEISQIYDEGKNNVDKKDSEE